VITVGQALIRQKPRLPHGMFLPWIEAEFGMSEQSAQKFAAIAKDILTDPQCLRVWVQRLSTNSPPHPHRRNSATASKRC